MGVTKGAQAWIDAAAKRLVDVVASAALLVLLFPVIAVVAVAIKVESRGSVFFRCRRVGLGGCEFQMLKFRKMYDGASGPPLTLSSDVRLTRVGRVLASTKLDELPQLWNVLKGEMSLVGPRPEDLALVELGGADQSMILKVKPGITGLSQLAFAKESEILDREDRISDYVNRLLPQKTALDRLYARRRSMRMDLGILAWTAVAVLFRRDVAVHRETGKLCARRRPREDEAKVAAPTLGSET
jgi:lipopolysaccharide/colanic/teichoic acid biosynthesis glycosyltransferase